jgi:Flp pilus assembly protein TadG
MALSQRRESNRKERGASLVELAILAPFLIVILAGVVEFAWIFGQHLDVRHGAREATRLAVVNYPAGTDPSSGTGNQNALDLVSEACARMDDSTNAVVSISTANGPNSETAGDVGSLILVEVSRPAETLTSLLNWALPSDLTLRSTAEARVLYPATWNNTTSATEVCP